MAQIYIGNGELTIDFTQAKSILPGTKVRVKNSELSVSRLITVKDVLASHSWPFDFVLVDKDDYEIPISHRSKIKIIKILKAVSS